MKANLNREGQNNIKRALYKKALQLQGEIIPRVPVNTGRLRSSIEVQQVNWYTILIGTNVLYAKPQEYGTAPFTPPLAPLKEWGRKALGSEQAGIAVWHNIRKHGIRPHPYFRPGINAFLARN